MDDLISRQQAIDVVNEYLRLSEVSKTVQNMTSIQAILRWLPSAQPQWIPVTERLPDEDGDYIVTDDSGGMKCVHESFFCKVECGEPYWDFVNVVAWMPLPKPYGGESDDSD